jgi:Fe-S cluster biogenesis protein NfuA
VANDTEFRSDLQRVGALVQELEAIIDPASQAAAKELVRVLMSIHGAGLQRIGEILKRSGELGSSLLDELAKDPVVSGLLVLYDLHPKEMQVRVEEKLREMGPKLFRMGAEAQLVNTAEGLVRVRVQVNGGSACGSTLRQVQAMIEDAMYEAAPDLAGVIVEGLEAPTSAGFVSVDKLLTATPGTSLRTAAEPVSSVMRS